MATDIVQSLFGVTPEAYQRQQAALLDKQALQFAQLDPMAQATYGIYRGAGQLGGALGRALGGEDPELARITARQQIAGQLDPNDLTTFDRGIEMMRQAGDGQGAMMLAMEREKARQQALVRSDEALVRADAAAKRQREAAALLQQQEAQAIAQRAFVPQEILPGIGAENTGETITPASFDVSRVAAELAARGPAGVAQLKALAEGQSIIEAQQVQNLAKNLFLPDGTQNKQVAQQLSQTLAGREVLKKFAPEVREVKKGEKLLERTDTGWKIIPITGQPEVQATSENAIQTLIASNAIHPSVVPYAQQIAKRFTTIDPEDQDKLMQTLTQLNNTATEREKDRTARETTAAGAAATRQLSQELVKLNIADAQRKEEAAADGKPIGINESTKLAEKSQSADKLVGIYESFKPEFAGFATDRVGDAALLIAGKSKDPKSVELFQWWQGYQENINKVRNELFGAALTAPEKAEFEKAMVTKGMSPQQAATNLKRQAELAVNAYNKLDNVLRVQGFSKAGLNALKPMGIRPGLESFVVPAAPAAAPR
jgi:hypothetical protein